MRLRLRGGLLVNRRKQAKRDACSRDIAFSLSCIDQMLDYSASSSFSFVVAECWVAEVKAECRESMYTRLRSIQSRGIRYEMINGRHGAIDTEKIEP